jgi:hypothetical protein
MNVAHADRNTAPAAAEPVPDEVDRDFLAWAKEHADDDHKKMALALANTEPLMRRPRKLQAEYRRVWLRRYVAESMQRGFLKSAAVVDVREKITKWTKQLGWTVSSNAALERAIWRVLAREKKKDGSNEGN